MIAFSSDGLDLRLQMLEQWLREKCNLSDFTLTPASGDASFRRYFRVYHANGTVIAMDAPPEHEDCGRYADLARHLRAIGVNTPEIFAEDRVQGFLLITDFGDRIYLNELNQHNADDLYNQALNTLLILQTNQINFKLPIYDAAFLQRELNLFDDWFLSIHLNLTLSTSEYNLLNNIYNLLIKNALEQPQVFVHRDFHSRNLMLTEFNNPGVLDFQDAVHGPITYDLVSLLRDCYIRWPAGQVIKWALNYFKLIQQAGILQEKNENILLRWFDLMGLQRHLKVCGIFARLNHRDGKKQYLKDLPLVLNYINAVTEQYQELELFNNFLKERVRSIIEL